MLVTAQKTFNLNMLNEQFLLTAIKMSWVLAKLSLQSWKFVFQNLPISLANFATFLYILCYVLSITVKLSTLSVSVLYRNENLL